MSTATILFLGIIVGVGLFFLAERWRKFRDIDFQIDPEKPPRLKPRGRLDRGPSRRK